MAWNVEFTDEFGEWWDSLDEIVHPAIDASVQLLIKMGPQLPFPYSSGVTGSRHNHMRELRLQRKGQPYRILYAFDPRRCAILLIGGNKTGRDRWYQEYIPVADALYDDHIENLILDGEIDG